MAESTASKTFYQRAVDEYGEEVAKKLCQRPVDPVTGYISRNMNSIHLLDGKTPCQRCGGVGLWTPGGGDHTEVLCLHCRDEWHEAAPELLDKHGYVFSKKKWRAAFEEFCKTKPKVVNVKAHNQAILEEDRLIHALMPEYFAKEVVK